MIKAQSARQRLQFFNVLNFPLVLCGLLLYALHHTGTFTWISWGYLLLLSAAYAGLICFFLLFLLPLVFHYLTLKKLPLIGLAALSGAGLFFLLSLDYFCYATFQTHLNAPLFSMLLSPARAQIFDLTASEYLSLGFILAGICALQFILVLITARFKPPPSHLLRASQLLLLGLYGLSQGVYVWADAAFERQILQVSELTPGFWGMTAKRFLARHHLVSPDKQQASFNQKSAVLHYPLKPLTLKPAAPSPNILIIAIDAWRFDHINSQNTPHIAAISHKFTRFNAHYSGGNCTRSGIFSLFYSANPADFAAFYRAGTGPVLFDVLTQKGYEIGIFPSASALSPPFHRTVFANVSGFNAETPGKDSIERDKAITHKVKQFSAQALNAAKPFFAFVFYDSVHAYHYPDKGISAPFQPAKKINHLNLSSANNQRLYRNQYQNALYFVDSLVGEVLDDLQAKNALDNTVIIITADHGEEFNDNGKGYWGHNSNFTPAQTHVPMLLHRPGQHAAAEINHVTSHYDIIPTLMNDLLGVKNPPADYALGHSLQDAAVRDVILMASYGKSALFIPKDNMLAEINRWGLYDIYDLKGNQKRHARLDGNLFRHALSQMNHFH